MQFLAYVDRYGSIWSKFQLKASILDPDRDISGLWPRGQIARRKRVSLEYLGPQDQARTCQHHAHMFQFCCNHRGPQPPVLSIALEYTGMVLVYSCLALEAQIFQAYLYSLENDRFPNTSPILFGVHFSKMYFPRRVLNRTPKIAKTPTCSDLIDCLMVF